MIALLLLAVAEKANWYDATTWPQAIVVVVLILAGAYLIGKWMD